MYIRSVPMFPDPTIAAVSLAMTPTLLQRRRPRKGRRSYLRNVIAQPSRIVRDDIAPFRCRRSGCQAPPNLPVNRAAVAPRSVERSRSNRHGRFTKDASPELVHAETATTYCHLSVDRSALYHFSEDPHIERFVPHVPRTNPSHRARGVGDRRRARAAVLVSSRLPTSSTIWPLDEDGLRRFQARFTTSAVRLHAIESGWLERMRTAPDLSVRVRRRGFEPWEAARRSMDHATATSRPTSVTAGRRSARRPRRSVDRVADRARRCGRCTTSQSMASSTSASSECTTPSHASSP